MKDKTLKNCMPEDCEKCDDEDCDVRHCLITDNKEE
jgi:hypothetical protein